MLRRVSGVEHDDPQKGHHIRQPVERRVEKAAELCDIARLPGYVAVEHVKEIRDYQYDAGPEKLSKAKEHATADVDRNTYGRENVRPDAGRHESTDHRIDDPH